jgi:hypothetical protein
MKLLAAAAFAALLFAGGAAIAGPGDPPVPASRNVTPKDFVLPEGSGCAGDIARFRAIQDNDLAMGHVAKSVYNQIRNEIAAAEQVCAAGKDREAQAMVRASKRRHGYPTDL